MYVCASDVEIPPQVTMSAVQDGSRVLAKVNGFSTKMTLTETDTKPEGAICGDTDYDIVVQLKQGQNEQRVAERELDSEFFIEEWEGQPERVKTRVDDGSGQYIVSDYRDPDRQFEPGPAQLIVKARGDGTVFGKRDIQLKANFDTRFDTKVTNVTASETDGKIDLSYEVAVPVPFGVTATIRESVSTQSGDVLSQREYTESFAGSLDISSTNKTKKNSQFSVTAKNTMDLNVCATVKNIE